MSFRLRSVLALAGVLLAAACAGGGDPTTPNPNPNPNPNPTPGTLAVSLSSTSGSVVAGNQATVTVNITRGGSFTGVVSLAAEGAPSGVTASFSSNSLASGVTSAGLTLQVGSGVAAGTYPITVRATGTGVTAATASYALTVTTAPVPTITLAASSGALTVAAGQQGTSTLTITRGGGFAGAVQLAATGAPTGVTTTFSANPVTGGSATVTFAVAAGATPGSYPITIRGTGTGVTDATTVITVTVTGEPRLELGTTTPNVTIQQGQQSAALPISITSENLTAPVTLTASTPTGVTATITPTSTTGTSAQVIIAVGAAVPAGNTSVTITGQSGNRSATVTFILTITSATAPDFGVTLAPASATVTAGQAATTTVTIARSGGFAGDVVFGTDLLPAGITATFTPGTVNGTTTQLQLQTSPTTPAGTYNISVRGTGTGIGVRQANFTLTVQPGGGGGGGNVTWQFCDTDRFPLWFAYRDGTSGAWTRVLPGANQTYSFTINADRGGVAFVIDDGGSDFDVAMFYYTRAELTALGTAECQNNPGRKTLTGTVAGLGAGQSATVAIGTGTGTASLNGPVTVTNVLDGPTDLFAARTSLNIPTLSTVPSAFVLRRNVNLPNNGSFGTVDFNGAEAFAPATANYTIGNAGADNLTVTMGFSTANGASGFFAFGPLTGGGTTRPVYGVPSARTQAGDLHYVLAIAVSGTSIIRQVAGYNREMTDRTLTLGPVLAEPTVSTVATAPYRRLRATGTIPPEYNQAVGIAYTQSGGTGRSWTISMSAGYAGGTAYDLEVPDLTGVAGFNASWGLVNGLATDWAVSASRVENNTGNGGPAENFRFFSGSRSGTLP
jgi:uncharacterized membrane protein